MKEMFMNKEQREISRKLRILRHAEETGHELKSGVFALVTGPHLEQSGLLSVHANDAVSARP